MNALIGMGAWPSSSELCSAAISCADPERGTGVRTPLPENHKHILFPSNTGPDPLKNHKATKPAFNVGPSSACKRNAIEMTFRWRADGGPHIVVFGSPLQLKKTVVKVGPPLTKLSGSAHALSWFCQRLNYTVFLCQAQFSSDNYTAVSTQGNNAKIY